METNIWRRVINRCVTQRNSCLQGDERGEAMSKLRFLIALLALGIAAPAWSQAVDPSGVPAGKCEPSKGHCVSAIVFSSNRENLALAVGDIWLMTMNEDGMFNDDEAVQLTENEIGVNGLLGANGFAKLSPHGKLIVFDSNRNRLPSEPGNTSDLFLMKTDGTHQKLLTRGSAATWSPHGEYIAFHRSASGDACPVSKPPPLPGIPGCPIKPDPGAATWDSDIFIMRVPELDDDGIEEPINITNTLLFIEDDPDWSPDGQKIVFTRHPTTDPAGNSPNAEICVLTLETLEVECLPDNLNANPKEERAAAWSPDGTRIAYMCRNPANNIFEICVMNEDGTGQTQLTFNPDFDGTPTWSPDGTKILFLRGQLGLPNPIDPGRAQLWLMNPDGTGQTQLTPHTATTPGVNALGSWGQLWVGGGGPQ
jgi:Tol biopolymer transport system component